ncbi:hypothetical protein H5410_058987 [Solanum commersonii]|uniref:mannan endo-1,4-beta-mannosidase n=1 Tax=Solanum commersonii TaxID=4109 RepID=A0A9J5W155_SOLCO|nr:hypothetical protein H5410_058987 [Solanum commersonii]
MSYTKRGCISGLFLLFLALACEANSWFIGRYKVTEVLKDTSIAGLSVCRTWVFSDGGDRALQISPGVYDERVFQGLDFVIAEAKKYGVRLILSLKVVTRLNSITKVAYKDDPTIMAWELMNEPCDLADYSGKNVNGWVQDMASFVKSLDNKHLLEVGMEGFYGDSIPERKSVNPDARNILKKPLVLAEFGKSSRGQGSRDIFMSSVYRNVYNLAKEGGTMGGNLVWQLMAHGMENYDDGYCIVLGQNPSTAQIISDQAHVMTALAHSFN